jgi:hypothetical protein
VTGSSSGGRLVLPAAALLLVAGCLLQILAGYSHVDLSGHAWGSDDAYISYRYARNLAAGEGLVFNPGERVEGFSNLLYVLLLAPAAAVVPPDRLYAVSAGLNLLFALAALLLLHRFARERLGPFEAGAVALLFALCPAVWVAVASGLETPLVLLIQVDFWVLAERSVEEGRRPSVAGLAILAVLAVLSRADGFLTPLLAAAFLGLRGRRRASFAVAGATLAAFGSLALLRLSYYGWPLPNTYYAKVTASLALRFEQGWQQLLSAAIGTGFLVYLAAFVLAGAREARKVSFPVVFAAGWLAYYLYIGGDVFYDRFLLFLFPMGTFLLLRLAAESRRPWGAVALALLLAVLQLVPLATDPRFRYESPKYDRWVLMGRALARQSPGTLLAVDAAGKMPFFSGLPALDMLGLTDAHIGHGRSTARGFFRVGHAKTDLPYVFSRRPGLIAVWLRDDWTLRAGPVAEPEICQREGYRLVYLLNTAQESRGRDLLDVRGSSADEIRRRVREGYRYGVFGRGAL